MYLFRYKMYFMMYIEKETRSSGVAALRWEVLINTRLIRNNMTRAHAQTYTHTHTRTRAHAHAHARTHTHTHTHTHRYGTFAGVLSLSLTNLTVIWIFQKAWISSENQILLPKDTQYVLRQKKSYRVIVVHCFNTSQVCNHTHEITRPMKAFYYNKYIWISLTHFPYEK